MDVRAVKRLFALLVAAPLLANAVQAQETRASRYEVEAAYLFHLANLTTWPDSTFADSTAPLRLCILGEDPFGELLDETVGNKEVEGRAIEIRRIAGDGEADRCQIVYAGGPLDEAVRALLSRAASGHSLVVTGDLEIWEAGAPVRFVARGGKLTLEIDREAVHETGLTMDSFLLAFAERSAG